MQELIVGFDIGSVSINTIICDNKGNIICELPYYRHFGNTIELCSNILQEIEKKYDIENISKVVFTGTHGKGIANHLNTFFEYETTAQATAVFKLYPETRTIISIGGHDSALFLIEKQNNNSFSIKDFKLNDACAAGTGSFIDQQAERIFSDLPSIQSIQNQQVRIETILNEFIKEGSKSDTPANVACRCTVFTKSDMIHLQNKGIAISHIISGLHEGVARNYKSTLINNRELKEPILFIGGYASNILAKRNKYSSISYNIRGIWNSIKCHS